MFQWHLTTTQAWGLHAARRISSWAAPSCGCPGIALFLWIAVRSLQLAVAVGSNEGAACMSMGLGPHFRSAISAAAGTRADRVLPLTWYMLWVAIVVCVVIGAAALDRRPPRSVQRPHPRTESPQSIKDVPVVRGADGVRWISVGVSVSAIPLVIALVWTMVTLARTSGPPANPGLVLDVTGRQWWWEVQVRIG